MAKKWVLLTKKQRKALVVKKSKQPKMNRKRLPSYYFHDG